MFRKNSKLVVTGLVAATLCLSGCPGGNTDGGKAADQTFEGSQFVPDGQNAGSLRLDVKKRNLAVGEVAGFFAHVRDSSGAGVPLTRVSCDSELGIAIVEPTEGAEITDSSGSISGKIGCALPGSFLFGCRLPVGGNLRQFVTIHCTGAVPAGADLFPGAAGGGLGTGGVGAGGGDVRITAVSLRDNPSSPTQEGVQVDVLQGLCGTAPDTTPETFGDTFVRIKVVNNTNFDINFSSLRYSVPNPTGSGGTFNSSAIAFLGQAFAGADGGEATLDALIFSSAGAGADKFFVNQSSGNVGIGAIGFRNITFTVSGTDSKGDSVSASGQTAVSFNNYNRCGA